MMIKNVYLLLVGILLISFTACKKSDNSGKGSGNVTDTTKTGKDEIGRASCRERV